MNCSTTVPPGTTTEMEQATSGLQSALDRWLRALEAIRVDRDDLGRRLRLLAHTVGVPGECGHCGGPVLWIRHHATGTVAPYDSDGQDHRFTCPKMEAL